MAPRASGRSRAGTAAAAMTLSAQMITAKAQANGRNQDKSLSITQKYTSTAFSPSIRNEIY